MNSTHPNWANRLLGSRTSRAALAVSLGLAACHADTQPTTPLPSPSANLRTCRPDQPIEHWLPMPDKLAEHIAQEQHVPVERLRQRSLIGQATCDTPFAMRLEATDILSAMWVADVGICQLLHIVPDVHRDATQTVVAACPNPTH